MQRRHNLLPRPANNHTCADILSDIFFPDNRCGRLPAPTKEGCILSSTHGCARDSSCATLQHQTGDSSSRRLSARMQTHASSGLNIKSVRGHLALPRQSLGRSAAQHCHQRILHCPIHAGRHPALPIHLQSTRHKLAAPHDCISLEQPTAPSHQVVKYSSQDVLYTRYAQARSPPKHRGRY